jgi:hypothetical protein
MFKALLLLPLAAGASLLATAPGLAQPTDRQLLSTFCDASSIKGATCTHAKKYPEADRGGCDVKLTDNRYAGHFVASGNPLLVIAYTSQCEAHATDFGGAVVFEEVAGKYAFKNFQPGITTRDCVTLPKSAQQDLLICLTGHSGQGVMETAVMQMVFTREFDASPKITPDILMTAEDTNGAYGSNVVTCKEGQKYFEVSKLGKGPRAETVTIEASFADAETVRTACGKGFPKPKETFGDLAPGDVYVPEGYEKHGKRTIDIGTRKITAE